MPNPVIATLAATAALAAAASVRKPVGSANHPLVKVPKIELDPSQRWKMEEDVYKQLKDKMTYVSATDRFGNRHHYVYPSYDTAQRWGKFFEADGRKRVNVTSSRPRGFDKSQVGFDKWLTPDGDLGGDIKVATSRFGNVFIQVGTYEPVSIPLNQIYDDRVRRRMATIAFRGNSIQDAGNYGGLLNTEQIERFIDFIRGQEDVEEKRELYKELAWLISNPRPPERLY